MTVIKGFNTRYSLNSRQHTRSTWQKLYDFKNNPKKFWSYVKNTVQKNSGIGPLKTKEGYQKSDSQSKPDILNDQFHSVFTEEDMEDFPNMGPSPHHAMRRISIDQYGVHKLFSGLQPHKATVPEEIPAFVLKAVADDLAPFLTRLFQASLDHGVVPQNWKDAMVVQIYKTVERHIAANYRPVSLTSITCKILEHIVCSSVMPHFDEFLLLQCSSGVVRHPRHLQVSVATRYCWVLIFASS